MQTAHGVKVSFEASIANILCLMVQTINLLYVVDEMFYSVLQCYSNQCYLCQWVESVTVNICHT